MSPDACEKRIGEQVFAFMDGSDDVVPWLERLGCKVVSQNGVWIVDGLVNMRVGLMRGMDPISTGICFGMILAGMLWPHIYPNLLKLIDAEWKRRRKQAKLAKSVDGVGLPHEGKVLAEHATKLHGGKL